MIYFKAVNGDEVLLNVDHIISVTEVIQDMNCVYIEAIQNKKWRVEGDLDKIGESISTARKARHADKIRIDREIENELPEKIRICGFDEK